MRVFSKLRGLFGGSKPQISAAVQVAPIAPVKVKPKQQTLPSFLKTATPNRTSQLPRKDNFLATTDIESFQLSGTTNKVIRELAQASPDFSAACFAYIRTAITDSFTAIAKNMDGTFNREGTQLLQAIITRMNTVGDYADGFSSVGTLRSISESLAKELLFYGALSGELVLDKARLPKAIAPVSVTQLQFFPDDTGLRPEQWLGSAKINLDFPTFFYISLDQDLLEPYSTSPLESAIQPVLFGTNFMNTLRKVVNRALHPRLSIKILEESFRKTLPSEVQLNPVALQEYMDTVISQIQATVNDLQPEEALVLFDSVQADYLNNGNISLDAEYKVLQGIVDSKTATGAKVLPAILGHGTGTQNQGSTETLLFMKNVFGAVQAKLNDFYSRVFTLAVRLYGLDVSVEFKYGDIDLRPESELEAFRSMKQERLLTQLSLGFITDDEASIALTGQLTPAGFAPLSGTRFKDTTPVVDPAANNYTNQSSGAGGAGDQKKKTDTPTQNKGGVKRVK